MYCMYDVEFRETLSTVLYLGRLASREISSLYVLPLITNDGISPSVHLAQHLFLSLPTGTTAGRGFAFAVILRRFGLCIPCKTCMPRCEVLGARYVSCYLQAGSKRPQARGKLREQHL